MLELTLPWPPTVNTYWRHPNKGPLAGRHLISAEGRLYRGVVAELTRTTRRIRPGSRLAVEYLCCPPDRRTRDLSNLLKALEDALVHAGVIEDDGCIDDFRMRRGPVSRPGSVTVTIRVLP